MSHNDQSERLEKHEFLRFSLDQALEHITFDNLVFQEEMYSDSKFFHKVMIRNRGRVVRFEVSVSLDPKNVRYFESPDKVTRKIFVTFNGNEEELDKLYRLFQQVEDIFEKVYRERLYMSEKAKSIFNGPHSIKRIPLLHSSRTGETTDREHAEIGIIVESHKNIDIKSNSVCINFGSIVYGPVTRYCKSYGTHGNQLMFVSHEPAIHS